MVQNTTKKLPKEAKGKSIFCHPPHFYNPFLFQLFTFHMLSLNYQ